MMQRCERTGLQPRACLRVFGWMALLAAVLMTSVLSQALAENATLKRMAFVSGVGTTGIDIYSGALLATRTIEESDDKIVLDIDGVNANDPVQTDFSRARNVSNVIFQPQDARHLRVIIRGSQLGKATTRFLAETPAAVTTASNLSFGVTGNGPAPLSPNASGALAPTLPASAQEAQTLLSLDTPLPAPESSSAPAYAPAMAAGAQAPFQTALANEGSPDVSSSALDTWLEPGTWVRAMANGEMTTLLIKGLLILGLLIGFGLFIRHKVFSTSPLPVAETARLGQAGSPRRPASGPRGRDWQDHDAQEDEPEARPPLFSPNRHPKKANHWATRPEPRAMPQDPPIGLSGMRSRAAQERPEPAAPAPRSGKAAESPRAAAAPAPPPPAPGRQALQQYRRQQAPVKKPVVNSPNAAMSRRPQGASVPQAPTRPVARELRGETIPENTQVLEFLKNVADLMEKNGDADKARRIQKNLRP